MGFRLPCLCRSGFPWAYLPPSGTLLFPAPNLHPARAALWADYRTIFSTPRGSPSSPVQSAALLTMTACRTLLALVLHASGTARACAGGPPFFTTTGDVRRGNVRDHVSLNTPGVWAPRCPLIGSVAQVLTGRGSSSPSQFRRSFFAQKSSATSPRSQPPCLPQVLPAQREVHRCHLRRMSGGVGGGGGGCRCVPKSLTEGGVYIYIYICVRKMHHRRHR